MKWDYIGEDVYRVDVPGGWLYRYGRYNGTQMVFVPNPQAETDRVLAAAKVAVDPPQTWAGMPTGEKVKPLDTTALKALLTRVAAFVSSSEYAGENAAVDQLSEDIEAFCRVLESKR